MLPIEISKKITQFYQPASISDYDSIIKLSDFSNLFAPIDFVSEENIKSALEKIGFDKENMIDDAYLIKSVKSI
jgi:hypothetical protein